MNIKERFYNKLEQLREQAMDKEAIAGKVRNWYIGGKPQVHIDRRNRKATVIAAGKEYTHKVSRKNGEHHVERTPYVTSDLEEASLYEAKKTKKPLPGVNSPAASAIRKIAGQGLVQHEQPWHESQKGHDVFRHTDDSGPVAKIRGFKVHQKTGKVTEIKGYRP